MKITKDKVVAIQFELSDPSGEILDDGGEGDEWYLMMGVGEAPPGLEKALEGKQVGDSFKVTLPPADAYGEREEQLVQKLPKTDLGEDVEIAVGDQLEAEADGSWELVTVVAVDEDTVTIDGNHELAGKTLVFDVKVVEVRDPTDEELQHGHAHGPHSHEDEDWDEWDEEDDDFDEDEEEEKA